MIAVICFLWLMSLGVGRGHEHDHDELEVFYADCSKYETDLFGGPVCGNDGTTYRNQVHLSCLNHHQKKKGIDEVGISSHGSCPGDMENSGCPWDPVYRPVCGSDGQTYCNKEWLQCCNNKTDEDDGEKVTVKGSGECHRIDPCLAEFQKGPPVCASNGLTYLGAEVVRCLSRHHADLAIIHEGGCTVDEVRKLYPSRRRVCEISKHHHETNPVCGPKNVTYGNPFIFLCTRPMAGSVLSGGACNSKVQTSCRKAVELDRQHEECKKNTPFKEVCGTDGLTYRSMDHLICAGKNNSQLVMLHGGPCTLRDSPCLRCKDLKDSAPVCGSDGVTYSSFVALSCVARSRDPSLRFVHLGVCVTKDSNDCYGYGCY